MNKYTLNTRDLKFITLLRDSNDQYCPYPKMPTNCGTWCPMFEIITVPSIKNNSLQIPIRVKLWCCGIEIAIKEN